MFYLFINKQGVAYGSDKDRLLAAANSNPADEVTIKERPEYFDVTTATLDEMGNIQIHPPEIPAPSQEERRRQAMRQLDNQYTEGKRELARQYLDAMIHGDSEAIQEIKAEITGLDAAYDKAADALMGDDEHA